MRRPGIGKAYAIQNQAGGEAGRARTQGGAQKVSDKLPGFRDESRFDSAIGSAAPHEESEAMETRRGMPV